MSTYPGVYISEKNTLSLGTTGLSGLTPLLIGHLRNKDNSDVVLKDGLTYVANFMEFSDKFLSAPLVYKLDLDELAAGDDSSESEPVPNGKKSKSKAKKTAAKNADGEAEEIERFAESDRVDDEFTPILDDKLIPNITLTTTNLNVFALALANYFDNGGAPCYVLSMASSDNARDIAAEIGEYSDLSLLAYIDTADNTLNEVNSSLGNFITDNQQCFLLTSKVTEIPVNYIAPQRTAEYTPNLRLSSSPTLYDEGFFVISANRVSRQRSLAEIGGSDTDADQALYTAIKTKILQADYSAVKNPEIPPLAAVAGAYCRTERTRGIWKAPANIGLIGVSPVETIGKKQHGELNSTNTNAIIWQASTGTTIMGARTKSPAAEEAWRYIPVRLLFNTVERDVRKMLAPVVFEPNSASTWQSVIAAINNYLYLLWKKGGLYGNTPQQAYHVQLTTSEDDISSGILRVSIGMAALRPIEFIYLEFTQNLLVNA